MLTERVSNFTINFIEMRIGNREQRCDASVFMFLKVSRQLFTLDTFGHQADEYIAPEVMFFYVFYVSMFAYEPGKF